MKTISVLTFFLFSIAGFAETVRPAPDFAWEGVSGKTSLKSLRGQPVVMLVAKSPRVGAFKKQIKRLREAYQQFASRNVVFVAAFSENDDRVNSDIPFVVASNGPRVIADFGVTEPFELIVIGKDGNVDLQTSRVCPASRVRDVIQNSFTAQAAERK